MNKLHTITEKIKKDYDWFDEAVWNGIDFIIRQELGKMVESLAWGSGFQSSNAIRDILGLSDGEKDYSQCGNCGNIKKNISCEHCKEKPVESNKELIKYACGCGNSVEVEAESDKYFFQKNVVCIKCSRQMFMNWTPRPEEPKSDFVQVELLAKTLWDAYWSDDLEAKPKKFEEPYLSDWLRVAQVALEWRK